MTKLLATLAVAAALGLAPARALAAAACTNPGKDGPATVSGVVNSYYPGVSGAAGASSVTVSGIDVSSGGSAKAIAAGDLVLILQVQDADIASSNDSSYGGSSPGSGQIALNNAGIYQYATVAASYAGGSTLPLTAPLLTTFRSAAAGGTAGQRTFQVIRVPQYSSLTLSGTVAAAPWNGATGGVVVVDVAGQLAWNNQLVEATGRGFRGGGGLWLQGRDPTQPAYLPTDFVATLAPLAPVLPTNPSSGAGPFMGSHAAKGEGIAGTPQYLFLPTTIGAAVNGAGSLFDTGVLGYPNGPMGRGAPGNAGGGGSDGDPQGAYAGGNDQNTGGGGGGGYAAGGMGGYGWTPGTPPGSPTGGYGGAGISMSTGRVTLGGGGGAGTSNNATGAPTWGLASSGASGGGVVLLRAKTITGSGTVNANGTSGNASVCNDASGGGGGGGAIVIYASGNNGNVGTVAINSKGGAGGSNTGNGTGNNSATCGAYNNQPHGPGGGGGGGFVGLSSLANATINVAGGADGVTSPSATSTAPYGSSSSPGGYQISTVASTDLPGASPSSLCFPLLTVTKVTTKANTVQGGTTAYTITVANSAGYGTATGVVLNDALPGTLNLASTDSITLAGGALRTSVANPAAGSTAPAWGSFSIPGGGSVVLSFTVNVPAATALGVLQNPATVVYDDPTRTAPGQTVTPGGTYLAGDFVLGSNYNPASSTGEDVTVRQPATASKGFSPVSVPPGGTTQLSIQIANPNAVALSAAAFNDVFPAGLTAVGGAVTASGGCSGFTPTNLAAGAASFAQSGGTVPASSTCTFSIQVTAAGAASYTNTLPAGAFTNNLNVTNVSAGSATLLAQPTIAKSFAPAAVAVGAPSTLSFTLSNPNAGQALSGASFTDTFPGGLVAVGGAVTVTGAGCTGFAPAAIAANAASFALTAGSLPAGGSCVVSFAVQGTSQGSYANTASGVTTVETVVPGPASNTARLGVGTIAVTKSFTPARIQSGGTSTVTLSFANPGVVPQAGGAFTDTLSGMAVASAQAVGGTCTGATPPALTAGQTSLSFTGLNIPAAGCTLTFTVVSNTPGTQTNTTSGVSTALLPAGPPSNTATLAVTAAPTISKAFAPTTVEVGGTSTATFTLVNSGPVPLTSAAFSDVLNAGLAVAGAGSVSAGGTCAGASSNAFSAGVAGATLSFTGLTIPPGGGGCTVSIPLTGSANSPAAGYANVASGVSSTEAATGAGSNTANLVVAAAPTIAKSFGTSPIAQGASSVITFTLSNSSAIALTGATFGDRLTNLTVTATGPAGGSCTGAASNSFTAGQTGALVFAGLTLPAAGACTVTLAVSSSTSGSNNNTATGVTTDQTPVAGPASNTATLVVLATAQLSVGFTPGTILASTAQPTSNASKIITLTNSNATALTSVAFTDALGSLQIYAAGAATGTCAGAGSNSFAAGAKNLSFSGLTVPANGSCTVIVQVASASLSPAAGWPDTTSGATSAQTPVAGSPSPPGYLTVLGYATIAKAFSPAAIAAGGTSTIVFTLSNPNSVSLSAAAFSDTFPTAPGAMTTSAAAQNYIGAGRGTCTGAIPSAGSTSVTSVSFSGLALPANSSCTVMVDVIVSATGNYSNTSSGVTAAETGASAGPVSNTATLASGRVAIAKAFTPAAVGVGEKSSLSFVLTSTVNAVRSPNVFTDTFPAGMTVASPLNAVNGCGGTLRDAGNTANLAAGQGGLSLQGGTLAANGTCTITVDVVTGAAGSFANTTSALVANGATAGPPSNTAVLTVVAKPTISEAFNPATVDTYRNSTLTFTLTNPNAGALTNCSFTDTLAGFFVSNPASIGGTCTGVTSTPALAYGATALSLKAATLSAGSCTITLPVTSTSAGTYPNTASGLLCDQFVSAGAASNTASVTFNKLPIQLLKSANAAQVPPGTAVTYTISYANPNAGMSLQNIVITDATPQFTGYTSAVCGVLPASLTSCTVTAPAVGSTGTITWTLGGTLDPGASGSVTVTVTVK